MKKEIKKYLKRIKVLELKPNDTIIIETDEVLTEMQYQKIKENIEHNFPQNKCIILEKMKLGIIRDITSEVNPPPPPNPKPPNGALSQYLE